MLTATYETEEKLVDIRDNKLYYVSKLKDGHCWMTQNLDLEIDTTRTYTHNDTDLGWDPDSFDTNATWAPDTTNGKYDLPVNGTSVPGWSNKITIHILQILVMYITIHQTLHQMI